MTNLAKFISKCCTINNMAWWRINILKGMFTTCWLLNSVRRVRGLSCAALFKTSALSSSTAFYWFLSLLYVDYGIIYMCVCVSEIFYVQYMLFKQSCSLLNMEQVASFLIILCYEDLC